MTTASLREDLILSHMRQVKLLARCLHRRCPQVELDDLISAGTIDLIQAVDRFDPSRNLKLKTLAEHRINGALLDYLRHIDPPERRSSFPKTARRCDRTVVGGRRDSGIAQALGVSLSKYVTLSRMIAASEPISIHGSAIASELTG